MKIVDALKNAASLLNNSETPFLDAELLLAYFLRVDRVFLFLNPFIELEENQKSKFFAAIKERSQGKPVAYIICSKEFWKSSFVVNEATLIPRPDSETMLEAFCKIFKNKNIFLKLADFGTGTGCLLISIMKEFKNIIGYGFEKMQKAFFITKQNIQNNQLSNRSTVFYTDWNNIRLRFDFDVIISNPPYIKKNVISALDVTVAKYEPRTALDGGISGLQSYEEILMLADLHLKRGGLIFFEIGIGQYSAVRLLAIKKKFLFYDVFSDLSGIKRIVVFKKS